MRRVGERMMRGVPTGGAVVWGERLGYLTLPVRSIYSLIRKLKGKGNSAVYKHQRAMPSPTLHAARFAILVISPHLPLKIFSKIH